MATLRLLRAPAGPARLTWPGRWHIEEYFQQAKGEAGLDHY